MTTVRVGRRGFVVASEWVEASSMGIPPGGHRAYAGRLAALGKPVWVGEGGAVWQGGLAQAWVGAAVGHSVRHAPDEDAAHAAFEADLLSAMRALEAGKLGLACLYAPTALESWQRAGAIRAAHEALEAGLAEAFGLALPQSAAALLANWRFDDAFDAVVAPGRVFTDEVAALARERRTTLVATDGECELADAWIAPGLVP